jgi:hypothetical protein
VQQTRHVARLDDERTGDTDAHRDEAAAAGAGQQPAAAPANIADTSVASRSSATALPADGATTNSAAASPTVFRLIATDRSPAPMRTDLTPPLDRSCASWQPYGRNAERK